MKTLAAVIAATLAISLACAETASAQSVSTTTSTTDECGNKRASPRVAIPTAVSRSPNSPRMRSAINRGSPRPTIPTAVSRSPNSAPMPTAIKRRSPRPAIPTVVSWSALRKPAPAPRHSKTGTGRYPAGLVSDPVMLGSLWRCIANDAALCLRHLDAFWISACRSGFPSVSTGIGAPSSIGGFDGSIGGWSLKCFTIVRARSGRIE